MGEPSNTRTDRRRPEDIVEAEAGSRLSRAIGLEQLQGAAEWVADEFRHDDDPTLRRAVELCDEIGRLELWL